MAESDPKKAILDAVDARLAAIEVEREALGAERLLLQRMRAHYAGYADGGAIYAAIASVTPSATPPSPPPVFSGMGITEGVRSYIQRFPGYTAPQVTDALQGVVKTNAKDVRKTISWTITDLIKRGYAKRQEDGKLYPTAEAQLIQGQGDLIEAP